MSDWKDMTAQEKWNYFMDQAIEQSKYPEMLEDLKADMRIASAFTAGMQAQIVRLKAQLRRDATCLLYTSPSPRD